ncbi:PAS domain S-box protein [Roseomonas nepalensis]|uniref:PAS domain S-box protein n=1 Tax=Muricoccus nepalensis TaxID=1854500 RepID=A0A502FU11_9PROT|nr:MASE4 domain-containing protein [Roseomonas nepalensis]TPG52463.1 PAS domain S-box protein [Roseomonas nepalensis]
MTKTANHATGLDLAPAGRWDRRVALAVVLLSAFVLAVVAPMAGQQWGAAPAFIPAYQAAVAVNDLVTAALLLAAFREARRPSLGLLGGAYLYTAFLVVAHTLSFPGLFGAGSLIGGPQSTVWLWLAWHVALPVVVIVHALRRDAGGVALSGRTPTTVQGMVLAAVTFAGGTVALATLGHDGLPALLEGNRYILGVTQPALALPLVLSLAALAALIVRTRLRRALDLWLAVTMGAWAVEILLSAVLNSGRFQAGFYVGRLYGLLASCTVLVSLLLATAALHGRLARALAGERDAVRIALDRSEARYRLMVESARGIAIVTLDADGIITGWNVGAEAMMGHTEAQALGRPGAIFFTPEDRAAGAPEAEMQSARDEGRAENERWHLRRDGSCFWGSGLVMPLADGTGYVKVFRDRTAEHDAVERMRESEGRLLALVKASAQVF